MITTLNHAAARSAAANPVQSDLTPDADAGRPTQGSVPEAPRLNLVADESSDYDPVAVAAASGVGARITLAVLADDYVRLITEALAATNSADLLLDTDRVSTFVRGSEQRIAEYLRELIAAASTSGHHLVAHLLLSRGCPGEVCGPVPPPAGDAAPRWLIQPQDLTPMEVSCCLTPASHWRCHAEYRMSPPPLLASRP